MNAVDDGVEGCMAAVIGPVGVQHADLGDGGITLFFLPEILLTEGDVVRVHGKAVAADKFFQRRAVQRAEAGQCRDFGWNLIPDAKRFRLFQCGFAGFHRVDDILFDLCDLCIRERAVKRVDFCGTDEGTFSAGEDLDALGRGVRTLIKLAGEILHGKDSGAAEIRLFAHKIKLRL